MTTKTALLPTTPPDVETWLRAMAPHELLKMREAGLSEYPYLFGMAIVKLAEAHAQYVRLMRRQTSDDALDVLQRCAELLDDYSDVVDGEDGPRPNRAMSLLTDVEAVIAKAGRR